MNIRLELEMEYLYSLNSFFDSAISDLILSSLTNSYEKKLLAEIKKDYHPVSLFKFKDRLTSLLNYVKTKLGVNFEVLLFIDDTKEECYAKAFPTTSEESANYVILSKQLVETISDEEMLFILGHEVSHILFDHAKIKWIINTIYPDGSNIPPYINNELKIWSQLAELSSDRAGLFVCGDHNIARSSLKKISSQLIPILDIRLLCLESDDMIYKYYKDLIHYKNDSFNTLYSSFLEKACYLLSKADGHVSTDEEEFILNRISRYKFLDKNYKLEIESLEIDDLYEEGILLSKSFPDKVKEIFLHLGVLSLKDKKLSRGEYEILSYIGNKIFKYNTSEIDDILISIIRSKFFNPFSEL